MIDKLKTEFGYVDGERENVGAYAKAEPLSSLEALRHAEERGSRVLTSAEYNKTIEWAENLMQRALQKKDIREFQKAQKILLDLYGTKIDTIGYAGARELTSTLVDFRNGSIKEANGISQGADYIYGHEGYHRFISELEKKTRELQEKGLTAYIQEFDPVTGLPVSVGPEPNAKYHGAVFSISPDVKDIGVVVRGQHHSVGEPCAKYDTAILPLEYKDIMLGPRTVSDNYKAQVRNTDRLKLAKLASVAGIGAAIIYELAKKTALGRISQEEAVEQIGKYASNKKIGRRAFNSALTLFLLTLAGCGGDGGSSAPNPPSPPNPPTPPAQKFEYSGNVTKRIANDGSRVNIGEVVLEGTQGTFRANIDSSGNFKVTGIPAGTYKRTTRDGNGDSIFVPQVESVVAINGNLTGQDYSAIERGANRFGVEFTPAVQGEYGVMIQSQGTLLPGTIKWTNAILGRFIDDTTVPPQYRGLPLQAFVAALTQVNNEDGPIFSGGKTPPPIVIGRPSNLDLTFEDSFGSVPLAQTDYPLLNNFIIRRARTLHANTLPPPTSTGLISHEDSHKYGAHHFTGPDKSIQNMGNGSFRPTSFDGLMHYLLNHKDVKPGNTSPDTNP